MVLSVAPVAAHLGVHSEDAVPSTATVPMGVPQLRAPWGRC